MLMLQRLVDEGNTVIVIKYNLGAIKSTNWIIDMGSGGGSSGGTMATKGTPENVANYFGSYVG